MKNQSLSAGKCFFRGAVSAGRNGSLTAELFFINAISVKSTHYHWKEVCGL